MADDEKEGKENSGRGNDWEVVSLTASAYAAAPGPPEVLGLPTDDDDDSKGVAESSKNEAESSRALFMSDHFVFPPSEHENLPLEPDDSYILQGLEGAFDAQSCEIRNESASEEGVDAVVEKMEKTGESWTTGKGLSEADSLHEIQFFEEKDRSGSTVNDESAVVSELLKVDQEPGDDSLFSSDSSSDVGKSPNTPKEERSSDSGLPCKAWWKKRAASIYAQAKEANTFWSVVVAAALMGLVILGQRWQQEQWQVHQLKWRFGINDEKMNRMFGPVSRFVGSHRRGSVLRSTASVER